MEKNKQNQIESASLGTPTDGKITERQGEDHCSYFLSWG
jgi:hypothetical protein